MARGNRKVRKWGWGLMGVGAAMLKSRDPKRIPSRPLPSPCGHPRDTPSPPMSFVLETPRLWLRPATQADLTTLHGLLTEPYVRQHLCDGEVWSLAQVEALLAQSQQTFDLGRFGLWLIETKSAPETIGFVGLWHFFREPQPQLTYALLPQATQAGYATEAATRIIQYSFEDLGYTYLVASCDQPNLASQRVARRLGMERVETRQVEGKPLLFFRLERPAL